MYINQFKVEIEWDPDIEMYIGLVPALPGAHSQASTLEELEVMMNEVAELCLEELSK